MLLLGVFASFVLNFSYLPVSEVTLSAAGGIATVPLFARKA